jgi:hypothetical protein
MLIEVLAGAAISLVLLVVIIGFVIKRAPLLFVADKLPERLHSGADEADELVTGSDGSEPSTARRVPGEQCPPGVDEAGLDAGEPNEYE